MHRRKSKKIKVGNIAIGGDAPISVQSMTKTDTRDVKSTVKQIKELEKAGCEIIRVAVPDLAAVESLGRIKRKIQIPLIADIHFNYKLALLAIEKGVDGLRLNPGNISKEEEIEAIVKSAKKARIPLRIGVNSGSLKMSEEPISSSVASSMVKASLNYIKILENLNFYNIILSLKASDVLTTIKAYQLMAKKCVYPFHIGITEAGLLLEGSIKSAVGIGSLLSQGIGDTIRVSLTDSPVEEVKVGYEILKSLGLRVYGPTIISCPTCARCQIDLVKMVRQVGEKINQFTAHDLRFANLKIALMGCEVNGPGEARDADIGIVGGKGGCLLFKHGKLIRKVKEKDLVKSLFTEIKKDLK